MIEFDSILGFLENGGGIDWGEVNSLAKFID